MARLKKENVNKCLSVIMEYIDDSSPQKMGKALLALEQLRNITAGIDQANLFCFGIPRADMGNSFESPKIIGSTEPATVSGICGPRPQIPDIYSPETAVSPCGPRPKIPDTL